MEPDKEIVHSLDRALLEAVEVDESFHIEDDKLANWALRKIADIRRRVRDAEAVAQEELRRIHEWLELQQIKAGREEAFFLGHLRGYHEQLLAADPKRKTIELPNGSLRARKAPDSWVIEDEDKVLAWAMDADKENLVRTKVELDRNALKKRLTIKGDQVVDPESGEIIEGITIEEGGTSFSVAPVTLTK